MAYFIVVNSKIKRVTVNDLPDAQRVYHAACREYPRVTVTFWEGHPMLEKSRRIAQRPAPGLLRAEVGVAV